MKVLVAIGDLWGHRRMYEDLIERYDLIRIFKTDTATDDLLACIDVGLVGFHFEQRRPDRLLNILRDHKIPAVCIRGVHSDEKIDDLVLEKIKKSYTQNLGCREFIDLEPYAESRDTPRVIAALEAAAGERKNEAPHVP
jgi:hypothetical protein